MPPTCPLRALNAPLIRPLSVTENPPKRGSGELFEK